jgi:RNA polymerase sigma-70 factor (ECF subfamily)
MGDTMASNIQQAKITGLAAYLPAVEETSASYQAIYAGNSDRIYALAFWMTDNELRAEELLGNVFHRAFAQGPEPTAEALDRALITELRESMALGSLALQCSAADGMASVRSNTLRVDLERAVVQLPATERLIYLMHDGEGYDHARIARSLGLDEKESQYGLHQARLRLRELLASLS